MIRYVLLFLFGLIVYNSHAQTINPLQIGQTHTIHSDVLDEDRVLNVYLPHDFKADSTYPVLYVLDGSMHEDFIHIVGLQQFFQLSFMAPECIIVGISNVDRQRDFTFKTDDAEMMESIPAGGHSEAFIRFIETELQPYINQTYLTDGVNMIIGQSLGGLLATEILLKKPQLFSHYFIVSPSLWWDNERLLKQAPELLANWPEDDRFVYISVGGKEHPIMRKDAKKLNAAIKKQKLSNLTLSFLKMKKETHASILHQSMYQGFAKLWINDGN